MSEDNASPRPEGEADPTSSESYTDSPVMLSVLFFLVPLIVVVAIAVTGGLR